MKKLLILLVIAITLCGCANRYGQRTYLADFRPYQKEGFTISPHTSGFTYESVGIISMRFIPGIKEKTDSDGTYREKYYGSDPYFYFSPTYDYIVAEMVKQAKELGANALLNFKITVLDGEYWASGFAAKLKE